MNKRGYRVRCWIGVGLAEAIVERADTVAQRADVAVERLGPEIEILAGLNDFRQKRTEGETKNEY